MNGTPCYNTRSDNVQVRGRLSATNFSKTQATSFSYCPLFDTTFKFRDNAYSSPQPSIGKEAEEPDLLRIFSATHRHSRDSRELPTSGISQCIAERTRVDRLPATFLLYYLSLYDRW